MEIQKKIIGLVFQFWGFLSKKNIRKDTEIWKSLNLQRIEFLDS